MNLREKRFGKRLQEKVGGLWVRTETDTEPGCPDFHVTLDNGVIQRWVELKVVTKDLLFFRPAQWAWMRRYNRHSYHGVLVLAEYDEGRIVCTNSHALFDGKHEVRNNYITVEVLWNEPHFRWLSEIEAAVYFRNCPIYIK